MGVSAAFPIAIEGEWDGRGRFGEAVPAGDYVTKTVSLAALPTVEPLARVGLNYAPKYLEGVGNDLSPVAAIPLASDRVALLGGLSEGPEYLAAVNSDGTYHWKMLKVVAGGNKGFASGCLCGNYIILLAANGDVSIVDSATGAVTAGFSNSGGAQQSKAHPVGFDTNEYNRQNICLGGYGTVLVYAYLEQDLVREWSVDTGGTGLTWVRDYAVTAPAGACVDPDTGRPLVIAGVTAVGAVGTFSNLLTSTTGGNVIRLNANGTTTEVIAAGVLVNPWRIAAESGTIAVASWAPDHRIRLYESGVVTTTFGSDGGRPDGVFDGEDSYNLHSLSFDANGDVWACEFFSAARVTRLIDGGDGSLTRLLMGGQNYEACPAPEGGTDATRVWINHRYGLCRYSVDLTTGATVLLEQYQFPGDEFWVGAGTRSVTRAGKIYVFSSGSYFRAWLYDHIGKTCRMVIGVERLDVSYWVSEPERDEIRDAAILAGVTDPLYFVWTAPDGGGNDVFPEYEVADCVGFGTSTATVTGGTQLELGPDLSIWMGSTRLPCRLTPTSVRADGVPVYSAFGRTDFAMFSLGGTEYTTGQWLTPAADGGCYQIVTGGFGGEPTQDFLSPTWGSYFHGALTGVAYLIRRDASGVVLWCSGLHESHAGQRSGRPFYPRVAAECNGLVFVGHACDNDGSGGLAVYDAASGLWTTEVGTMPPHGEYVPDHSRYGVTQSDTTVISAVVDPGIAGAYLLFSGSNSYGSVVRVRNLSVARTSGTVVAAASPSITLSGTGLTQTFYNTADLSGAPAKTDVANLWRLETDYPVGSLLTGVTGDPFSYTATGLFTPVKTEQHRFSVYPASVWSPDMKLWIGGTLVVDTANFVGVSASSAGVTLGRSAAIQLTAGVAVAVRVEVRNAPRSAFSGYYWGPRYLVGLSVSTTSTDERDVPLAQLTPTGTAPDLPPSAYVGWTLPSVWHWKLRTYLSVARRSPGHNCPDLYGAGDIQIGDECLVLTSTLNSPAVLYTPAGSSPWPADYDGFGGGSPWAVEFWLKTSQTSESPGRSGGYRTIGDHGGVNRYRSLPEMILGPSYTIFRGAGNGTILAPGLADGNWHSIRFDSAADETEMFVDGSSVGSASWDDVKVVPPHGVCIGAPVPSVSGQSVVWSVRDFKVFPSG